MKTSIGAVLVYLMGLFVGLLLGLGFFGQPTIAIYPAVFVGGVVFGLAGAALEFVLKVDTACATIR